MNLVPSLCKSPGRRSQALSPAPREREGRAVGASLSTCPGSHSKFPGARDTPQGTRALTQGRLRLPASARGAALPARLAGRPGRAAARRNPFPFPPFPAFAGIKRPPAQLELGEVWGGAVELGRAGSERRKPPFPSKPPSIFFSRAPPPAPRPSPLSYTLLAGAQLPRGPCVPQRAPAPLLYPSSWFKMTMTRTRERACVPCGRPGATSAAGFAKDAGFI